MSDAHMLTASARTLGIVCGLGVAILSAAYAVVLAGGLLSLPSQQVPIGDPFFAILEILLIVTMPLMIGLAIAVHAWSTAEAKVFSLAALVFVSVLAGLTCSLHFVLLTVGRRAELSTLTWMPLVLSFTWPSVAYAVDILAWDVFFALFALCAAPVFSGDRVATSIRVLLIASGALAFGGLSGVVANNMQFRSIGIIGYAGVFPVAALLMAIVFHRAAPRRVPATVRPS